MGLIIFKVAYNPELTNRFKVWIRNNITASMFSQDKDETMHFQVDIIKCAIDDLLDLDERIPCGDIDLSILEDCLEQGVTYIEI